VHGLMRPLLSDKQQKSKIKLKFSSSSRVKYLSQLVISSMFSTDNSLRSNPLPSQLMTRSTGLLPSLITLSMFALPLKNGRKKVEAVAAVASDVKEAVEEAKENKEGEGEGDMMMAEAPAMDPPAAAE